MEATYDLTKRYYSADDLLFAIDLFVEYPAEPLKRLALKIRTRALSDPELIQLIEFIRLDSYALTRAIETGVHPITGFTAYITHEDIARARRLIKRNENLIAHLENLKIKSGCDCE